MKKILAGLIIIFCMQCDIDRKKLLLINSTNETIYYELHCDTVVNYEELYLRKVLPYDSVKPLFAKGGPGAWEYKINRESKDSTLHIFIFSDNSITDEIINNRGYKRMDFKVKDLDSLNWTVTIQ